MSNKQTDAVVLELFNRVKKRKAEIYKVIKTAWATSCTLQLSEGNVASAVNIATVSDPKKLVNIYAFILAKEHFVSLAGLDLGFDTTDYTFQGSTFGDWKKDIARRMSVLGINAQKEELLALEARLDRLITPEQRRELELEDIQKSMGKV